MDFYIHRETGERAALVGGRLQLESGQTVEVDERMWEAEHRPQRKIGPMLVAELCYEADRLLCQRIGVYEPRRQDWLTMRHHEREEWAGEDPPDFEEVRRRLYLYLRKALEPYGER